MINQLFKQHLSFIKYLTVYCWCMDAAYVRVDRSLLGSPLPCTPRLKYSMYPFTAVMSVTALWISTLFFNVSVRSPEFAPIYFFIRYPWLLFNVSLTLLFVEAVVFSLVFLHNRSEFAVSLSHLVHILNYSQSWITGSFLWVCLSLRVPMAFLTLMYFPTDPRSWRNI